jgi:modification methylase
MAELSKPEEMNTTHRLIQGDSRQMPFIKNESVHLVVTSPPYWTLKKYNDNESQLGHVADYEAFLNELSKVWKEVYRVLTPGGRLVCVVGDVCLSRRQHGRHVVVPLHSDIAVICRKIGFDNLNPIIWHKISNANYEVSNGTKFLGKPYEPNAIIKNDIEFVLMERKPGGYRQPTAKQRQLSMISKEEYGAWFRQFWTLTGASTKVHPAPYPLELAYRLVRMFSFWGDTVLDPFCGTGTTMLAAMKSGRNSIGIELDPEYCQLAAKRLQHETGFMYSTINLDFFKSAPDLHGGALLRENHEAYSVGKHKPRKTPAPGPMHGSRQRDNKIMQRKKPRP